MLTVFSKLIGFCFKVFGMVVLLHMSKVGCEGVASLSYSACVFMNLGVDAPKMKLAKILTHKPYNTVALTYGSRNAC